MPSLENRIPPPIVALLTVLAIIFTAKIDNLINLPTLASNSLMVIFIIVGLALPISGVLSFKKAQTTVNPLNPSAASNLVTSGIFRFTRNPMYLGMLFLTLAAVCYTSSLVSLLWVLGFFHYIGRFQITPEERAMLELFGDQFKQYQSKVRRWL